MQPILREARLKVGRQRYPGLPAYGNSLLIGCADNAAARRAMAESLPGAPRRWLIDAGHVAGEISWDEPASGYSTVV